MNEEQVRELSSRSEGPTLDFKTAHGSKEELAKDVMAIANVLRNGERGYLLFGVDENPGDHTGVVVGLKAPPPDDADLHASIKHLLNRMPAFTYEVVQLDALTVGVLEIRGEGRRPYFPLRDSGTVLARHIARKRNGSSNDIPSPTEMIEWAREDDPVLHESAVLDLEEKKRARQAQFNVRFARSAHQSWPAVVVENVGRCNIAAEVIEVRWRSTCSVVTVAFARDSAENQGSPEEPQVELCSLGGTQAIRPGENNAVQMYVPEEDMKRVFDGVPLGHLEVELVDVRVVAISEFGHRADQRLEVGSQIRL
jgi:hypothetical protein